MIQALDTVQFLETLGLNSALLASISRDHSQALKATPGFLPFDPSREILSMVPNASKASSKMLVLRVCLVRSF